MIEKIAQRKSLELKQKLVKAGMSYKPKDFFKRVAFLSFLFAFAISFVVFAAASQFDGSLGFVLFSFIISFAVFFMLFLRIPDYRIIKTEKEINKEIVFASRFIIIEMSSGVSLYNSLKNAAKYYPSIGKYFMKIIDDVDLGQNLEDAINSIIMNSPSQRLNRILWQILNSIGTGADIGEALKSVTDQILKEQMIEVQEYGKKLNPLAMFYMTVAVIIPSLGITIGVIFGLFMGIEITRSLFMLAAFFLGFVQFIFISIIKTIRPALEL
jgi:flagellar protein FlaJ